MLRRLSAHIPGVAENAKSGRMKERKEMKDSEREEGRRWRETEG